MTGFDERCVANMRCDHACDRIVPFSDHWWTAIRCTSLKEKVRRSAVELQHKTIVPALDSSIP